MSGANLPPCTCGRDAKGGPYPRVHAPDCAYVQPVKQIFAEQLERFVNAGAAAQAAVDKLTSRVPSKKDRQVCPVCSDSPCGCGFSSESLVFERRAGALAAVLEALRGCVDDDERLAVLRLAAEHFDIDLSEEPRSSPPLFVDVPLSHKDLALICVGVAFLVGKILNPREALPATPRDVVLDARELLERLEAAASVFPRTVPR